MAGPTGFIFRVLHKSPDFLNWEIRCSKRLRPESQRPRSAASEARFGQLPAKTSQIGALWRAVPRNQVTDRLNAPVRGLSTVTADSDFRVSALMSYSKSPVAMPWAPSPQRLDRLAKHPWLDRQEPIGFWGEGGPWPTTRGLSRWAFTWPGSSLRTS